MSTFRLDRPVIDIRMTQTDNENEYRIDLVEEGVKHAVTTIIFKLDPANDLRIDAKTDLKNEIKSPVKIEASSKPQVPDVDIRRAFKRVIKLIHNPLEDMSLV